MNGLKILKMKNCEYAHDDNALVYRDPHNKTQTYKQHKKYKVAIKVSLFFFSLTFIILELF